MPDRPHPSPRARLGFWLAFGAALLGEALLLVALLADMAFAQGQATPLHDIITRLQQVIVGLAAGLATLFLTIGGVRYLFAGGDPSQIEKAKVTLRSAAIGYGIAMLAGTLFTLLQCIVGG